MTDAGTRTTAPPRPAPSDGQRPLVWLASAIHPRAVAELAEVAEVVTGFGDQAVPFAEVADRVEAVVLRGGRFGAEQFASAPRLRVLARHGVGVDSVDVEAATAAGVVVTNTPTANVTSVAEHVFALLLAVRRQVVRADRYQRAGSGGQVRSLLGGTELSGSTLGLVGFGRIARQVATIGRGFGMTVLAHDPVLPDEQVAAAGARPVPLAELFDASDTVSLHVPLLPSTRHLVGRTELARLRPGAVVVNTSRGAIVDEAALLEALESGHLGGAGLDVTETEPLPADHPLLHRPDVVVTPHVGGQTEQSLERVALDAVRNVVAVLQGREPASAVNRVPVGRVSVPG